MEKFVDALMWTLIPVFVVAKGANLLEIGAGMAPWRRVSPAKARLVTGLDVSPVMLAAARSRADAASVDLAPVEGTIQPPDQAVERGAERELSDGTDAHR